MNYPISSKCTTIFVRLVILKSKYFMEATVRDNILIWFGLVYGVVWFMVFNDTFNNISVISWWPVLLVEETGVPRENHRPVASN